MCTRGDSILSTRYSKYIKWSIPSYMYPGTVPGTGTLVTSRYEQMGAGTSTRYWYLVPSVHMIIVGLWTVVDC